MLGVVQVATDGGVAVIDAVAVPDLGALSSVLRDPAVPVVLHGGTQDLEIFASLACDPVRGVFDTQIEAAFLGYGLQVGLSTLLERVLKVQIKKDQTYTDWVRRPLRREQLAYAADDVHHLLALHGGLRADVERRGRVAWADEEMRALEEPARYAPVPPEERYEWVKGWQKLGGRELAVLRELAAWRERAAERADIRPNFVANDIVLTSLAARPVETMEELRHVRGLASGAVDRHGRAVLAAIRAGVACPSERWPPRPPRERGRTPAPGLAALLRAVVQAVAEREDIAAEVIASGREIEALASQGGRGAALDGLAVEHEPDRDDLALRPVGPPRGDVELLRGGERRGDVGPKARGHRGRREECEDEREDAGAYGRIPSRGTDRACRSRLRGSRSCC